MLPVSCIPFALTSQMSWWWTGGLEAVPRTLPSVQAGAPCSWAGLPGARAAACTLLDAWRLLLTFLGEPAKVTVVLPYSLEVLGRGKV